MQSSPSAAVGYLILVSLLSSAQEPAQQNRSAKAAASISGHLIIDGKPASGGTVVLLKEDENSYARTIARTTVGPAGEYKFEGLVRGQYSIRAEMGPYAAARKEPASKININESEAIEGVDLALIRGGVITGRVTEVSGRPVIGATLKAIPSGEAAESYYASSISLTASTDDRGIYRFFGLAPGKYRVQLQGSDPASPMVDARGALPITFYPGVSEVGTATVLEVAAGAEVADIDIKVVRPVKSKTYAVSGRTLDAQTGMPVGKIYITLEARREHTSTSFAGRSDTSGAFRIDGLPSGSYSATAAADSEANRYGEPIAFEVPGSDVSGVDLKVYRGGTISGIVVIEGTDQAAVHAKLGHFQIDSSPVGSDGSFRVSGLQPGKHGLSVREAGAALNPSVLRIERDGALLPDGVEVGPGENVTGVRVVVGYYTGLIRGEVVIEGGTLPEGVRLYLSLNRVDQDRPVSGRIRQSVSPDSRGKFVFESLPAGQYQVSMFAIGPPNARPTGRVVTSKIISVTNETEGEVTLVFDLNNQRQDR